METGDDGQEEEQEAVRNGPPKRKLEMAEYPNFMAKRFASSMPYRDATLQKWYDKTRLTTGKSKKVTPPQKKHSKILWKAFPKESKLLLLQRDVQLKINAYVFRRPSWCNGQVLTKYYIMLCYVILCYIIYICVFKCHTVGYCCHCFT